MRNVLSKTLNSEMSRRQDADGALSVVHPALERFLFADLLTTVVLAPLAYGTVESWSIALFELNALLLAVLLAWQFVLRAETKFRFHRLLLPPVALLLFGFAQIPFSLDPYATRQAVVKLLALVIYFVVALQVLTSRERVRRLFLVLACLGFALAVFGIMQKLTWNGKLYWIRPFSSGTPFGPYVNYNHFAGLMEMLFPLPLAYLLFGGVSREKRGLWFFVATCMGAAILISLSRGGMLSLGVEILAFGFVGRLLRQQGRQIPKAFGVLLLAAVALLTAWISYDQITARWRVTGGIGNEFLATGRAGMWQDSWRIFLAHPARGVGLGAFPAVYPTYGWSSAYRERLEQTHNDYLQLLTDGGIIGGLIGLWFLLELLLLAYRHWRRIRAGKITSRLERSLIIGSLIAVSGLLVHSFTDFNLQITANALCFLLQAAVAAACEFSQTSTLTNDH